jgi:hypothetical protein
VEAGEFRLRNSSYAYAHQNCNNEPQRFAFFFAGRRNGMREKPHWTALFSHRTSSPSSVQRGMERELPRACTLETAIA